MTQGNKYKAAVFNQFLAGELTRAPREVPGCVGRALRRFYPEIDAQQLRDYTDSIYETIVSDEGLLLNDWQDRVLKEHWG